jgi:hypothetical protein
MSQKFTFIIEVNKKGECLGKAFNRVDAQKAIAEFNALREKGMEAYLFQFPVADKRSKSIEQRDATTAATAQPTTEQRIENETEAKRVAQEAVDKAELLAQENAVNKIKKSKNKIAGV